MVNLARWFKHLFMPPWAWRRAFPHATLDAIEAAIHQSETRHNGEIRFAIETSLAPVQVASLTNCPPKVPMQRNPVNDVPSQGMWATESMKESPRAAKLFDWVQIQLRGIDRPQSFSA